MSSSASPVSSRRPQHGEAKRETIDSLLSFAEGRALPAWPATLFLEVSNVCDLRCAMCYYFSDVNPHMFDFMASEKRGFLTVDRLEPLTEQLRHALVVHCFGEGEPTIHPEFQTLLSTLGDYEAMLDFFTNGMHLTSSLCDFLVSQQVSRVTVSFSGCTQEEYEAVYRRGKFEQVLAGIKRLSDTKTRRGSRYPTISINSIAFEHHVAAFDRFVDLMADHGAEVVTLKRLTVFPGISPLARFAALYRRWVEGDVLDRARERASLRGIELDLRGFELTEVASQADYEIEKQRMDAWMLNPKSLPGPLSVESFLDHGKRTHLGEDPMFSHSSSRGCGTPPDIHDIDDLARTVLHQRMQPRSARPDGSHILTLHGAELEHALALQENTSDAPPYFCFEPFTNLYVRQNGHTKPCCFMPPDALSLGDLGRSSGSEVWSGEPYEAMRSAILEHFYPMKACGVCLEYKVMPRDTGASVLAHQVSEYLAWFREVFRDELFASDPVGRLRSLGDNADIVYRYRKHHRPTTDYAGDSRLRVLQVHSESDIGLDPFRVANLQEQIEGSGHRCESVALEEIQWNGGASGLEMLIRGCDFVVLHHLAWSTKVASLIAAARRVGTLVVFEADDQLFVPHPDGGLGCQRRLPACHPSIWGQLVARYTATYRAADCYLAATPLGARARPSIGKPASFLRPVLGRRQLAAIERARCSRGARSRRRAQEVVIGCDLEFGAHAFPSLLPRLYEVLASSPAARLTLIGSCSPNGLAEFDSRVDSYENVTWGRKLEVLANVDLVLIPTDSRDLFDRCAPCFTYLLASALEVPVIMGRTDEAELLIDDGRTGMLVGSGEWASTMDLLLRVPERRSALGHEARRDVLERHTTSSPVDILSFLQAAADKDAGVASRDSKGPIDPGFRVELDRAGRAEQAQIHLDVHQGDGETVVSLTEGRVTQSFRCGSNGLSAVVVYLVAPGTRPGDLCFRLFDVKDDRVLVTQRIHGNNVYPDAWNPIAFRPIHDSQDREFEFSLELSGRGRGDVAVCVNEEPVPEDGAWSLGSEARRGSLRFQTHCSPAVPMVS